MKKLGKHAAIVLVAGAVAPLLAACNSGGTSNAAVPNVVGQRLDVAEGQVKDAGLQYVEVGGGAFGIVVKSNWTVCSTDPSSGSTASKVRLIVDRTCGESSTSPASSGSVTGDSATSDTTSSDSSSSSDTSSDSTTSTVASDTGSAESWSMPDLRGEDLQAAQDAIQALTDDAIWYTGSHDATGRGRHQWLDRDWQVCTQSVAPGRTITSDSKIDFGVVRVQTESCP